MKLLLQVHLRIRKVMKLMEMEKRKKLLLLGGPRMLRRRRRRIKLPRRSKNLKINPTAQTPTMGLIWLKTRRRMHLLWMWKSVLRRLLHWRRRSPAKKWMLLPKLLPKRPRQGMQSLLQQRKRRRTITTSNLCGKKKPCFLTSIQEFVFLVHMMMPNKQVGFRLWLL